MASRTARVLKEDEIQELIALDEKDMTLTFFMENFGQFNEKVKYHPYDEMTIPVGAYGINKKNTNKVKTTVGIFLWNKYFLEHNLDGVYINETINDKRWDKLMDKISYMILEDELPISKLENILLKAQKVMPLVSVLTPSVTDKFLKSSAACQGKKKELAKKYAKEIEAGDAVTAEKMEKELMSYAKDYLGDDPAMDIYNSGARSSFKNHYKNMYLMKGAVSNPDPDAEKQFDIALSCYNDGISKDEYSLFCTALSNGPYQRSQKTAGGGYWEKLFLSSYQHLKLGPKGSDCGTKDTVEVYLTEKNIGDWMYSYIVDRGQLVELTSKNRDKYIGQKVHFRFASLCEYKDPTCFCNACIGNLFYRQGTQNIGIAIKDIASVIKNKFMKAFHDGTIGIVEMDVKKAFGE